MRCTDLGERSSYDSCLLLKPASVSNAKHPIPGEVLPFSPQSPHLLGALPPRAGEK